MAFVLDALAAQVLKNVKAMGEAEIHMLLSVSGEIKKLEANMEPLQNFLTDAERRRINEKSVQTWVSKLKDAMYEATDILELCQLEAMDRQEEHVSSSSSGLCSHEGALAEMLHKCLQPYAVSWDKLKGILHPFLFCLYNPGFAHDVGSRINMLNNELDSIREGAAKHNFINLTPYEERRRPSTSSANPRSEDAEFVESDLVGDQIKKNTEELVQQLITDHDSINAVKVVGIVGQGGIGKSTLAKKVLKSEAIKEEFNIKIWLSVTQQFTKVNLLRDAIAHIEGEHRGNTDETLLVQALTNALSKKKFLLVLDDVWNQEAWERVLRVPVLNAGIKQPGSRVLVTSRKDGVVWGMGDSALPVWILHVNKLDDEDAWCLLKKHLRPQVDVGSDFDELKDIGIRIVKKCDGLPLAIKVMGGLLKRKDPDKRGWQFVLHKDFGWKEEDRLREELNYSVSLSYDDLSPELKQCFLYYSLLPKGSIFVEDTVISMWISEGFVQHDGRLESDQLDLEQIGIGYHRELVARNLLESDDSNNNTSQYTLHDVVRSFAQFMVKEEAFVAHKYEADSKNVLPKNQKFRRLSIFHTQLEFGILEKQEILRTLLIGCNINPGDSLAHFAGLRVLDIRSEYSHWLADSLCELRHLRYLSFSNTNISRLPGDIHKMRFLQHIQLDGCAYLGKLPNSITKLVCLRYLSLRGSGVDVIPRGFGGLTNLRTLHGFPAKMVGDWCTLEELEALSHLRSLMIKSLENVPGSSFARRAQISNKKNLEYLELNCFHYEKGIQVHLIGPDQQERIEVVFDELCPPPILDTLRITRYFGRRLPHWLQSPAATTFKSVRSINIGYISYCTQLPDGLCRIHGLEELVICHAPAVEHVGRDFQSLPKGGGGAAFPNLRKLVLEDLYGWKEWEWEEEQRKVIAMPALEHLKLSDCEKLTHLPRGLASCHRYNLRSIELWKLTLLEYVENFPSVVQLTVSLCSELKRISGLAKLRMVNIYWCPKLKLLEGVLALDSLNMDWTHWEVTGPDARCTPKGHQAEDKLPTLLPEGLVITRSLER